MLQHKQQNCDPQIPDPGSQGEPGWPGQDNASYLSGIMAATEGRPRQLDNVLKVSLDPIWRILQSLMFAYLKRVLLSLGAG